MELTQSRLRHLLAITLVLSLLVASAIVVTSSGALLRRQDNAIPLTETATSAASLGTQAAAAVPTSSFAPIGFSEFAALPAGFIAWGDYDQDGDLDLVTGCIYGDRVAHILRQDPVGIFTEVQALSCGHDIQGRSQPWADYDGDGDLDLALPARDSSFMYENDDGTFVPDTRTSMPVQSTGGAWFQWGDVDGDNDPDLVIVGVNSSGVFLNDGTGYLTISSGLPARDNHSGDLEDYDQDGDLDLVLNGKTPGGPGPWHLEVYSNVSGAFSLNLTLPGIAGAGTQWVDYDGDGRLDFFVVGQDSSLVEHVELWRQNTTGGFALDTSQSALNAFASLQPQPRNQGLADWGDYDNDGDADLIISATTSGGCLTRTFRNDPTGTLVADSRTGLDGVPVCYSYPGWGDFDSDGDLDLAAWDIADGTEVFINAVADP